MYIVFPADEKVKARLDAVCKSLNISFEKWFETALIESEYDVLVQFLGNPEEAKAWKWDEDMLGLGFASLWGLSPSGFDTLPNSILPLITSNRVEG